MLWTTTSILCYLFITPQSSNFLTIVLFHLNVLFFLVPLACRIQMDNQIVVSDYAQMDRVLREERAYILNLVKQIKKAGCNVLLIQKSILR